MDDVALLASGDGALQLTVKQFAAEFEAAGIRISNTKSAHYRSIFMKLGDKLLPKVEEF